MKNAIKWQGRVRKGAAFAVRWHCSVTDDLTPDDHV
jgi:hypothetical protein